ncbi:MAG: AI-2E family transporter [SAR324 cluster bacterium]|nr:AI-2E family transporter [SAR324 cluster bacterium]
MEDTNHSNAVFILCYIILIGLIGYMILPFAHSLLFAGILTGVFHPLKSSLESRWKKPKTASAIVCFIIVLSVLIPAIYLIIKLSEEAVVLFQYINQYMNEETIRKIMFDGDYVPDIVKKMIGLAGIDYNFESIKELVLKFSQDVGRLVLGTLNSWISNMFTFLLHFALMLVIIYALLSEDQRVKEFFLALSPMPDDEEELMIDKFNQMNFVTLAGNGIGGLIQGIGAGIGFWFAGINSIVLWTSAMVILAFIPLLGISIIYIPACIYLWIMDQHTASIGLFIYCTLIALLVENWFKAWFVGNRVQINSVLVFLSIMGGMAGFGITGIFYGPLIISLFLIFVGLYHKKYTNTDIQDILPITQPLDESVQPDLKRAESES